MTARRGEGGARSGGRTGWPRPSAARGVLVGVLLIAVALVASTGPARAGSSGTTPTFVRNIGGPLHADVYPSGVEVAPDGTLVVADTGNDVIRKYSAVDGHQIWHVGTQGSGVDQFSEPRDVGIDASGNIYVADAMNRRIVVLGPDGSWITTFTGPPGDLMGTPMGATVSGSKLYVADAGVNVIRVFDLAGNQTLKVVPVAGCVLTGIRDADADAAGNIYGASYAANKIVKFSPNGATCMKVWGTKGSLPGQFKSPYGVRIAFDPVANVQQVYVADSNNQRVQVFTLLGKLVPGGSIGVPGEPDQPGTHTQLRRVAVAADGDLWTADLWGWRLQRFDRTSTGWVLPSPPETIGTPLPAPTDTHVFHEVRGLSVSDGVIAAADVVHHRAVLMSTTTGALLGSCGQRGSTLGSFNWPRGVAWDELTGQLWVADTKQYRIQVIDPSTCEGIDKMGTKGSGFDQFNWVYALAIRQSDRLAVVADGKNGRIKVYDVATRMPLAVYGTKGGGVGRFRDPQGISVDPVTGHVYVADTGNNRIVELSVSSSGAVSWVRVYTGGFLGPQGVAADTNGRIYVADSGNDRVAVVSKQTGLVTGTFDGPDGMDSPGAVTVDAAGDVYISDTYNDRIEKFTWGSSNPSISVGNVTVPEGNVGPTSASFSVTLSQPSAATVTVGWTTGDASAVAPNDYASASGTVMFDPGDTSETVSVNVSGDALAESDETFSVTLSAPTNATIADGSGIGTITNDDSAVLPSLAIGDASIREGDAGTRIAALPVALSASSGSTVTVGWATASGTASGPGDYVDASGVLAFDPGQLEQAVDVTLNGDALVEPNETFSVALSSPTDATIADGLGTVIIMNDDTAPATEVSLDVSVEVSNRMVRARGTSTPGTPGIAVKVSLIRLVDGGRMGLHRRLVPLIAVDGDGSSSFRTGFDRPRPGHYMVRVSYPGDDTHLATRTTTRFRVR